MNKILAQKIEMVDTIKTIAEAYQEISVLRMQKIRSSVLYTRQYLDELSELFYDVKEAYKYQMKLEKNKEHAIEKNGRSAVVLMVSTISIF